MMGAMRTPGSPRALVPVLTLALGLALALTLGLELGGCAREGEDAHATPDATVLAGDTVRLSSGYSEVYLLVKGHLSSTPKGTYPTPTPATPATDDADGYADEGGDEGGYGDTDGFSTLSGKDMVPVVGQSAQSKTVADGRGHSFMGNGEALEVRTTGDSSATLTLSLYDFALIGGEAVCLAYFDDTLAVLYATGAGHNYSSADYVLAAWGAPRSLVLFFDVSEPNNPQFIQSVGISGVPRAIAVRAGSLCVATAHKVAPDVGTDGLWMSLGEGARSIVDISESLELRKDDPSAFTPCLYRGDDLVPLRPGQLYLSEYGSYTTMTVFASFDLAARDCASVFAVYDLARPDATTYLVEASGFFVDYTVSYRGAPATVTLGVPIGADGLMPGIGKVSWQDAE